MQREKHILSNKNFISQQKIAVKVPEAISLEDQSNKILRTQTLETKENLNSDVEDQNGKKIPPLQMIDELV